MDPLIAAAVISTIGNVGTAIGGGKMNKKNRQFAREMYARQRADALADWNMVNAYNAPDAQMMRLAQAGLNPALIYGKGAGDMSSAPIRGVTGHIPEQANPLAHNVTAGITNSLLAAPQYKLAQQQAKNLVTQEKNIAADTAQKDAQRLKILQDIDTGKFSLGQQKRLADTEFGIAQEQLEALKVSTYNKKQEELRASALHAPTLDGAVLENIQKIAATANLRVQTEHTKAGTKLIVAQTKGQNLKNIYEQNTMAERAAAEIGTLWENYEQLKKTGRIQDINLQWRKLGITERDNLLERMIGLNFTEDADALIGGVLGAGAAASMFLGGRSKIFRGARSLFSPGSRAGSRSAESAVRRYLQNLRNQ